METLPIGIFQVKVGPYWHKVNSASQAVVRSGVWEEHQECLRSARILKLAQSGSEIRGNRQSWKPGLEDREGLSGDSAMLSFEVCCAALAVFPEVCCGYITRLPTAAQLSSLGHSPGLQRVSLQILVTTPTFFSGRKKTTACSRVGKQWEVVDWIKVGVYVLIAETKPKALRTKCFGSSLSERTYGLL